MSLAIEEIHVPQSVEGPEATDFVEYVRIRNEVEAAALGTPALAMTPRQLRPDFENNPHRLRRLFTARADGVVVGRGMTTVRPHQLEVGASVSVDVLPDHRGEGVGSALFAVVTEAARDAGCALLKANASHSAALGGDRIVAATGFGGVAASDPGARFLARHGFVLEQVVRISALATGDLEAVLEPVERDATQRAGEDYRLHTWHGATPHGWLDDVAVLRTRMSTDEPSGGLEVRVDTWDSKRVVAHDRRMQGSGQSVVPVAVEHVPTGRLVGITELIVPDEGTVAAQDDTLVVAEHRGRRLGALLKAVAGRAMLEQHPHIEQIVTWNAEENRPMLDVNEQLGFRAIGHDGAWQKRP